MKITEKIIRFFYKNWSILLIIIIGLLPIIFFKKGLLLLAGEGITGLDINHYFKYYDLYSWREQLSLGQPNIWTPHLFILDFFFYIFSLVGFSLRTIQIFWFVFLWISAGLAIYFLIETISDNHRYKLWGVFAALLYLFNTFTMVKPIDENFRLVYIALPLVLAFFIKGLKEEKSATKYALLIGLSSLIFASASVNPPAVSIIWIALFFYFCFDVLINRKFSANKIFFVFKILLFYILLNSWWMITTIPTMVSFSEPLEKVMTFSASSTKLFEAFRFLGWWAFKSGHQGVCYFPYHLSYYGKSIIVTFLSFLIPVSTFGCLLFKKRNKYIMFFAALAIVGIFLVKGTGKPFGQIYNFIWKNVPGFWIFREPFTKFTPLAIFASSIMFGYTISKISKKISIHFRDRKNGLIFNFLFLFCMISMVCIVAFPIFTRQIFREKSIRAMKSQYIKFPQYWLDAGDWFENYDRDNKIFVLPKSGYGAPYDWEYGISTPGTVAKLFIPNPLLTYRIPFSRGQRLINDLYSYFHPESEVKLVNVLRFFGVRYVLQQNDLSWNNALPDTYPPPIIKNILKNQEEIKLFKQFGKLDVYQLQDDRFLSPIYAP